MKTQWVKPLNAKPSDTSGTLLSEEKNILNATNTPYNYILFNNEYYRLVKNATITDTETDKKVPYNYYGCVSTNDSKAINKFFKVNMSTGEWTLLTLDVDLSDYYTKTESDARYVKQVANQNRDIAYVHSTTIGETYFTITQSNEGDSLARRGPKGELKVSNPTNDLSAVNKKYGESNYYRVTNGTNIPENADLNNYTTPGTYQVANDTIGGTIKNTPYPYAFKLIVEIFSYYIIQRLQCQDATDLWERTRKGTAWSDWVKIATTSYVDNKTAVLIDNSLLGA